MEFLKSVVSFLSKEMTEPTNYSWFHILFIGIVIIATALLCVFFKNCSDKTMRRIVLISWLTILTLEVYKQFIFSVEIDANGALVWDYLWYAFPYQLCSTPLYVMPFIAFMKECKFRDALIAYMSAFSFFGGIAVYVFPNDVFVSTIGINIQTMIHHGTQVVIGIFLAVHQRNKLGFFHYLKSIPVFAALSTVAIILNEIGFKALPDDTFNMFYISRHYSCTLPVLSAIYPNVPYIAFLLLYLIGFVIVSIIMYYAQYGIIKLVGKIKNDKKSKA